MTLTRSGRTWAAALAMGGAVFGVVWLAGPSPADPHHGSTSLTATVTRYVDAFNARDWSKLSAVIPDACRATAEAQVRVMADTYLYGATARIIAVDEYAGTSTLGATYPFVSPEETSVTASWRWDGHRWLTSVQGCELDLVNA